MYPTIGIDFGSRRTKCVLFDGKTIVEREIFDTWTLSQKSISAWVDSVGKRMSAVGTTGYGRKVGALKFGGKPITEIRAFAEGAGILSPKAGALVDIGGQDAKAIFLGPDGKVANFEMNDRCAAGTGKFFELLAQTLHIGLDELPIIALAAAECIPITSTCAVFAESEIVGKMSEGASSASLAQGVFRSVAERLAAMLWRTGFAKLATHDGDPVFMIGGGANECLARELSEILGVRVSLHDQGSFFGAVGAAIIAANLDEERSHND